MGKLYQKKGTSMSLDKVINHVILNYRDKIDIKFH